MTYGEKPVAIRRFHDISLQEYMTYLYMPIVMPGHSSVRMSKRLAPLSPIVACAVALENLTNPDRHKFVYITVKHGFATRDNPLNRPGWHCDGFGTDDINYVWWDGRGTRFAIQDFDDISPGHVESMRQFECQIQPEHIVEYEPKVLYRLTPQVVHATPIIPGAGERRTFMKLSFSRHRYNLVGNSHNYMFQYDWKMYERSDARNHPIYGEADFYPEETP